MANLSLFATTAFIAVMSAVVAVAVGYPMGHWLASLRRFKKLLTSVFLLPFLLPAFLVGLSLRPLLGDALDNTAVALTALIGAHALMNAGFVAVVTASSMVPREQIEAARLDGASNTTIATRIQLPQQLPALGAASLLVALYSATSYGLVITLGQGSIRTLETEIVTAALWRLDLSAAAVLAGLQTLLTISFFLFARRLGAHPAPLFGHTDVSVVSSRLGGVLGVGFVAVVVWVVGAVFVRAVTVGPGLWGNIGNLMGRGERDLLNVTVWQAVGNSLRNTVIVVLLSIVIAWWLSRKKVGLAVVLPIGISPVVFGLAALVASGYLPPTLAGSWLLLPLVQVIFVMPLAYNIIAPARSSMAHDVMEAAILDGARRGQLFRWIEAPLLMAPVSAAAALVALASFGEFGAARFLTYGSNETLPLVMFRLMSRPGPENVGMAMVAASLFILLAVFVVWVVSHVGSATRAGEGDSRER